MVRDTSFSPDRQRTRGRRTSTQWTDFLEPSVLKHKAFEYEAEIRVAFRFGWDPRLTSPANLMQARELLIKAIGEDPDSLRILMLDYGHTSPMVDETDLQQYSAPIPDQVFVSACVDPRAPDYKRSFIEKFLRDQHIAVCQSDAFGLSYMGLGVYPDRLRTVT